MKLNEMIDQMRKLYAEGKTAMAEIVFSNDTPSWGRHDYSEDERTYTFSNLQKFFRNDCIGNSWYASCKGSDDYPRLDYYIDDWIVERCDIVSVKPTTC